MNCPKCGKESLRMQFQSIVSYQLTGIAEGPNGPEVLVNESTLISEADQETPAGVFCLACRAEWETVEDLSNEIDKPRKKTMGKRK